MTVSIILGAALCASFASLACVAAYAALTVPSADKAPATTATKRRAFVALASDGLPLAAFDAPPDVDVVALAEWRREQGAWGAKSIATVWY